jgi:hypothetical protein
MPHESFPIAASLSIPANIIQKNFCEKSRFEHVSLHCTTEAMKYTAMFPVPPIAVSLSLTAKLMICIEKTPRKFQFGKKSAKVYHCWYSSTEQLQVAL